MIPSHLHPAAGALVLAAVLSSCSIPGARVQGGYTEVRLSGDAALSPTLGGVPLGTIQNSIEHDLGLGDESGSPYGRVELALGLPRLTASAFRYQEEGTGRLEANFGNISAGTTVDSEMDFLNAKAALTFDIDLGPVRLSPGAAVDVFDMEMSVVDGTSLIREEVDEVIPVPMPFLQAGLELGAFDLTAEAGAMSLELDDFEGEFFDATALANYEVLPHMEVFAGYRALSIDAEGVVDDQDFDADLLLQGWIIGAGVTF